MRMKHYKSNDIYNSTYVHTHCALSLTALSVPCNSLHSFPLTCIHLRCAIPRVIFQGCLCDQGSKAIHWIVVSSAGGTQLKTLILPLPQTTFIKKTLLCHNGYISYKKNARQRLLGSVGKALHWSLSQASCGASCICDLGALTRRWEAEPESVLEDLKSREDLENNRTDFISK